MYTSKFARLVYPGAFENPLNPGFQYISKLTQLRPPRVSLDMLDYHLQVLLELYSEATPAATRGILCVDTSFHRYIAAKMKIDTEYMSINNHLMIRSNYIFQTYLQHSHRR